MSSNGRSRVLGSSMPMAAISIAIAPEMNMTTPFTPTRLRLAMIMNAGNTAEIPLHEYTDPTALDTH